MRRITRYDGLYGDKSKQHSTEYIFSELVETRSRNFDWEIKPHIHPQLYQLFFIEHGNFEFYDANQRRQSQGPCLILIPPATLHGFTFNSGVSGRILTMSDALVDTLLPESNILMPMLQEIQCLNTFLPVNPPEHLLSLLVSIDRELFSNQPEKRVMLQALLQQLFLSIYRLWQPNAASSAGSDRVSLSYFRKFQLYIREIDASHTVAQIAKEVGISPVHLNRICQETTGKSAGKLVQERLLEEARMYLIYTTYSVSEIAYRLNFEYPNYFARFFRKHTGLTPTQFREERHDG